MPNRNKPVERMEEEILEHDLITKYPLNVEYFQDFIQRWLVESVWLNHLHISFPVIDLRVPKSFEWSIKNAHWVPELNLEPYPYVR